MDLATIIGLVLATVAIVFSAYRGDINPRIFIEAYDAFILIFAGTTGATLVSFPLRTFLRGVRTGFAMAFTEPQNHEHEIIANLVTFAEKARREGLLALENEASELDDEFMRKGIQLVIDGRDADVIRKILETEVLFVQERNAKAEQVFTTMGGFSPTLGIIGTVLGLIAMLNKLGAAAKGGDAAGTLGSAVAQAFIATFFGILLANILWLPIAAKIKERNGQLLLLREIQIEGILSIQAGDNPRLLEEKLHAFLDPSERESDVEEGGTVGEPAMAS